MTPTFASHFDALSGWRLSLGRRLADLSHYLGEHELTDGPIEDSLAALAQRLAGEKLIVAFVAEFSRGKSELINAIFFADFGKRLLPSSAGRTTMCPTELLHHAAMAPSIRLLPIETRHKDGTVAEFKRYPDEWVVVPLDLASAEQMGEALHAVSQVKRVPLEVAMQLGLAGEETGNGMSEGDTVEVPCWRHAVINFPHPLLQRGLVVLDTPGLNAIGAEPELTLAQLPEAHTVLFLLAADAGVTRTDLDVWESHLAGEDRSARSNRIVVLNKIDGLWDQLRADADIDAEVARQIEDAARILDVASDQVFAVSAQKALAAKINGDDALLARSRIAELESALSHSLIPRKREIVGGAIRADVRAIAHGARATLEARRDGVALQLAELRALRGKNEDVVSHMMRRVADEKALFERGLHRFTALRNLITQETKQVFDCIGHDALKMNAGRTRRRIEASPFTKGIRSAMNDFFDILRADFERGAKATGEIQTLMETMYARFAEEHALERFHPPSFSMLKYQKEIERLERAYATHFNTLWNMVSKAKFALMRRFFETIASRVAHVYDIANRDVDSWLRGVMSPLETQVREHHRQLRRRLDSVKRIQGASGELEERLAELDEAMAEVDKQIAALEADVAMVDAVIAQPEPLPLAANA